MIDLFTLNKAKQYTDSKADKVYVDSIKEKVDINASQLSQSVNEIGTIKTDYAKKTDVNTTVQSLDIKVNQLASGSPKGTYATLTALATAFPIGNSNIYITADNGNWNYWNGSAWVSGGVYQSTGIADNSITTPKFNNGSITYEKLNTSLNGIFQEIYTAITYALTQGYKKYTNEFVNDTGWHYSETMVVAGEKYKVSGQSWLSIPVCLFLDASNNVINFYPTVQDSSMTNYVDTEVIIPINAVKMICNKYLSRTFDIKKRSDILINESKLPQKNTIKTKITIIGDSLSADDSPQATVKYHKLLADNDNYVITNLAKGGHGYKRADDGDNAFWQQATKIPVDNDIVFLFGSFNDLGKVISGEYTIGTSVDNASTSTNTIMECINKTITNIRAIKNDAIIVIASPTPWASFHPGGGANKDVSEQYVEAVKTVAHNQNCMFLDLFHESNIWSWNNAWNTTYCTDGVHLNDLGHKRFLYPIIRNCLNKVNANI